MDGSGVETLEASVPAVAVDPDLLRSGRLAGMTMWRAIFVLAWPVIIESILNATVGLVDTTMAAGISSEATDAIGGMAYVLWATAMLGIALGVGATAMVSRSVGKKRFAVANAAIGQCTLVASVGGTVMGAFFFATAPWFASMMSLKGQAGELAVGYLRVCAVGVPAMTLIEALNSSIRGGGDSMRPMLVMMLVNAVNAGFTFLLSGVDLAVSSLDAAGELHRTVLVRNPFHDHNFGVNGIAAGTTIAWLLGAGLLVWSLSRSEASHGLKLTVRRMRPHWHTINRLLRVGVPNFLETLGMWFGNFVAILMVGWLHHPGLLGAHIVAARIEAFSYMPGFAMSLAAGTLVGQYLGSGRPASAKKAAVRCCAVAGAFMGLMGLVFIVFPSLVVGLFTQQKEHLEIVPQLLRITGVVQIPFALAIVLRGVLRGAGDTRAAMWITWVSTYLIRLPLAWLCCGVDIPLPDGHVIPNPAPLRSLHIEGLPGFWVGLCSEILLRAALFALVTMQGKWQRARV